LTATLFLLTRLPAAALYAQDSDVRLYARYAAEWHTAAAEGRSFCQLHRQHVEEEMARAGQTGAQLAEYRDVEYPPLAVLWMAVPGGDPDTYVPVYIAWMVVIDLAVLFLVIVLVRWLFPEDKPLAQCRRWLVYILCSWPLYGVLYTRLDLGVAALVTASLALLVSRRHWTLTLGVLALAIHFKLMPVVLAPLWLIGTLPLATLRGPRRPLLEALAWRTVVLAGFGLALLAPFYLWEGPAVLGFLEYHKERGIEIESTYSTLLHLLQPFDHGWEVYHSHGSVNVRSALAPTLTTAATLVMALTLLAALGAFLAALRRRGPHAAGAATGGTTVAQAYPHLVANAALLLLLVSIAANKVFSPQYLLWVLPLAALIDWSPWPRRLLWAALGAVCFLTMRIFPDCFVGDIVYVVRRDGAAVVLGGPTSYGALLLLLRNGLFVALTVGVGLRLWRSHAGPATAPSAPRDAWHNSDGQSIGVSCGKEACLVPCPARQGPVL
jgi:hypothetical protein